MPRTLTNSWHKRCAPFCLLVCLGLLFATPRSAEAKSSVELYYTQAQIFSGALRFLRIDKGFAVTEKDPDAAYLLFKYTHQAQESFGAVEMIKTGDSVRVSIKLPQLPSYHESMLQTALLRKLTEDYGPSQARKRAAPTKDKGEKAPKKAEEEGPPSPPSPKSEPKREP